MKGKKISAMLLTMLMVCTMLPMSIFAGVTDVDEGNDPGIVITKGYTSQAVLKLVRVTPDGSIMGEINTEKSTYSVDFDSPDGQDILQTLEDNMKAKYEDYYTFCDKSVTSTVHYSSPEVLNSDGDVIIAGDVDELVNVYIENGKVSPTLTINKYEVREIEYKVIAKAASAPQDITRAEIVGASLSFNAGDKPVFTAKSAEPDLYYVYLEQWSEVGGDKYITSSDFFNRDENLLITEFEAGKEYKYMAWLKPAENLNENGDFLSYKASLSTCRALVVNGEEYALADDMVTDEGEAGIFLYPNLKIAVANNTNEKPSEIIPAPSKPANATSTSSKPAAVTSPKTGNYSNMLTYELLASLFGAGLISLMAFNRKKQSAK